jgi:hypothetical protein
MIFIELVIIQQKMILKIMLFIDAIRAVISLIMNMLSVFGDIVINNAIRLIINI